MYFQTWADFWQMGGYGFYVWLAYGTTALGLVLLVAQNHWRKRQLMHDLQREQQRTMRQQRREQGGLQ